jgi:putative copper resistance protein D
VLLGAALVASRFVHYAALTTLFGLSLFPLYAEVRGADTRRPSGIWLTLSALAVPLSGLLWLCFSTAGMSGDMAAAYDPSAIATVVREMEFGKIWVARLALSGLALGLVLARPGSRLIPLLAGGLLASVALTGHAQMEEGADRLIHMAADGLHLLAAGVWLGALVAILAVARTPTGPDPAGDVALGRTLASFSKAGTLAVATLVGSGLVNAWFLVGSVPALASTAYGRLLVAKLGVFAAMLALAAANRWRLTPALLAPGDALAPGDLRRRLYRQVMVEQALGLLVLVIVAVLGTLDPANAAT